MTKVEFAAAAKGDEKHAPDVEAFAFLMDLALGEADPYGPRHLLNDSQGLRCVKVLSRAATPR